MSLLPKKTYSKRNNDLSLLSDKEKENVDPFDELLSSPLKQEVQFQPLSFWGKKIRRLESKDKNKRVDYGLFKASDSDEPISPCQRKWKCKARCTESKARTLPPKSRNHKLSDRRKAYSTAYSHIKKTKPHKSVLSNKNESVLETNEIEESKGWSPNSTSYPNTSMEETLKLSHKGCVTPVFVNVNTYFNELNSVTPVRSERNYYASDDTANFKVNNLSFKIYEDNNTSEQQLGGTSKETLICSTKEDSSNCTVCFNKSMDKTLIPFSPDGFKFVSVRRRFNYPDYMADEGSSDLVRLKKNNSNLVRLWDEQKLVSPSNLNFDDSSPEVSILGDVYDETLIDYGDNSVSLCYNESVDSTLTNEDCSHIVDEESKEISTLQCLSENSVSDSFTLISFNDTELGLIQELLSANAKDGVILESSFTSDDASSSFIDEETVINLGLRPETNDSPAAAPGTKKDVTQSVSNGVSVLTTSMSELSIKNPIGDSLSEAETEETEIVPKESNCKDTEKSSFSLELRNVTTKRRGGFNKKYERTAFNRLSRATTQEPQKRKETNAEMEIDHSLWMPGRASLDWNTSISFVNPVFESTRVFDKGHGKRQTNRFEDGESILQETLSGIDRTYNLKPGKKWLRSRSVLKQIQNGTIGGGVLESTRITGRKFESFVRETMEIQSEKSVFFTSLTEIADSNKTLIGGSAKNIHPDGSNSNKTAFELRNMSEKFNDSDFCIDTCLEKSSLNYTVKVIERKEKASAFRSALGLENDQSSQKEDSVGDESSSISARDFILIHCGQEDVLSFEEHFNERTLGSCKKIGEGVYGEVFKCSDTVLKIIPIEGADKVNGEPQKTFAEIISEVVIASKLSNLRKGKQHRTKGFSEMKRCWCVKGKYPKYLLELWEEYDQEGSGSENDSPAMFKDDQLYIILELANGGKDLESFVFSSASQSLSVFVQAAFSLAAAEKAFEFEHRDLHWGNVLISETKDKFMTVYLDGVEYKIPTKGVKVCIIDFTLSRINHEGCCIFNDLSVDPSLFASEGDYQFEVYRMMLREVKNDWSLFRPKTNLFWLHYTLDKMLKMVRYKNKKAKIHIKHLKDLKSLASVILEYENSTDFVLDEPLNDVLNKL